MLEKNVQGIWRAGLNWLVGRMRPAGRSLATPVLSVDNLFRHIATLYFIFNSFES